MRFEVITNKRTYGVYAKDQIEAFSKAYQKLTKNELIQTIKRKIPDSTTV